MRIGLASFRRFDAGRLREGGLYASMLLSVIAVAGITAWFMLPEPSDGFDGRKLLDTARALIEKNTKTTKS